jgi:hypothetical protein
MPRPRRLSVGEEQDRPIAPKRPVGRIGLDGARKSTVSGHPTSTSGERLRRDAARRGGRRPGDAVGQSRRLGVVACPGEIASVLEIRGLRLCDDEIDAADHATCGNGDGR